MAEAQLGVVLTLDSVEPLLLLCARYSASTERVCVCACGLGFENKLGGSTACAVS